MPIARHALLVLHGARYLARDVLDQCAAARDVQRLNPVADRQQRQRHAERQRKPADPDRAPRQVEVLLVQRGCPLRDPILDEIKEALDADRAGTSRYRPHAEVMAELDQFLREKIGAAEFERLLMEEQEQFPSSGASWQALDRSRRC